MLQSPLRGCAPWPVGALEGADIIASVVVCLCNGLRFLHCRHAGLEYALAVEDRCARHRKPRAHGELRAPLQRMRNSFPRDKHEDAGDKQHQEIDNEREVFLQTVVPGCTRCYSAMGTSKRCHMSTRKRWRRPPPAPPRIEDRYWRRAPGGLVGWSGRVLQPDQLIRQHEPEKDAPITATPHARASIGGR